jgi:hypothetical protein
MAIGLPHHDSRRVAIEHRRDDPPIEEAEPIVVFGARSECGDGDLVLSIATQVKAVRVGMTATEAREIGI